MHNAVGVYVCVYYNFVSFIFMYYIINLIKLQFHRIFEHYYFQSMYCISESEKVVIRGPDKHANSTKTFTCIIICTFKTTYLKSEVLLLFEHLLLESLKFTQVHCFAWCLPIANQHRRSSFDIATMLLCFAAASQQIFFVVFIIIISRVMGGGGFLKLPP